VFGGGCAQQVPLHSNLPSLQVGEHTLLTQCRVPPGMLGHEELVQAPQWSGSLEMSTQEPPQFVWVEPQQTLLLHVVPAPQTWPQVPQFWLSDW
jgi:hypothetical protein